MQVKIIIGTVAFMLTMIILGFAALREPARLEEFSEAFVGRSIETGAHIYQNNCATCHGLEGSAESCFNTAGEQIGCLGRPLNNAALLCGDTSQRMEALDWEGTKHDFIETTIAAGRIGTEMPTWSERFGGPMRDDQVEDVTQFVLNWESEELCSQPLEPAYDWPDDVEDFLAEFPEGDAANGEELYNVTYGCAACHGDPAVDGSGAVGPWLGDIAEVGDTRVNGQDSTQYVYHSILYPNEFIAPDCPTGPCASPSAMPDTFPLRMGDNPQDMRDVLEFLLNGDIPN